MPFVPDEPTGFIPDKQPMTAGFIPDEQPTTKRGIVGESATALSRGFLNIGEKYIGASQKFSPLWGKYGIGGVYRGLTASEEEMKSALEQTGGDKEKAAELILSGKTLTTARKKIKTVKEKIPQTRTGLGGWVINTLGEGAPILGTSLATGNAVGWAGPAMNMFMIAGESAYEEAKASGASETTALRDYALSGAIEAALEMWGVSKLLKFKSAGKGSLKAFVKNVKQKLWKQAGGNLKNIGGNMLKSALVEGLEEGSQSIGGFIVATLPGGVKLPKKPDGSIDFKTMIEQVGMETAGGALLGSVVPAGMNVPSGLTTAADPSIGLIEKSAKEIQADEKLGEFEKARAIRDLREMLPEDYEYQPEVTEGAEETTPINVYQDAEGNNYNEQDVTMQKLESGESQIVAKENGEPVVLNPELSGSAIETEAEPTITPEVKPEAKQPVSTKGFEIGQKVRPSDRNNIGTIIDISDDTAKVRFINRKTGAKAVKNFALSSLKPLGQKTVKPKKVLPTSKVLERVKSPVSPFYISDQAQQVLDIADKFEKHLSEYEARRPELVKGTKARMGGKFKKFRAVLDSLRGQDPREVVNKARSAVKGMSREIFPEFNDLFTAEDIKSMQRAVNESTLVEGQKLSITEVFDDLEKGVLPHRSNIRKFDRFFGTNIAVIGKNKPKTWKQKAWAYAKVPGQTYKAIKASFDYSGMGIQGFMFGTAHPIKWLKTAAPGHRAMFSKDYLRLRDIMRQAHPNYNRLTAKGQLFTKAGTSQTEEEFVNNFAKKIPVIGRFIAASERAHCECLNSMRDTALDIVDEWGEDTTWGKEEDLVRHISNITGRGQGDPKGWFEKHIDIWSAGFWTPRMMRGDFGSLADPLTKPHLRKMCAYDLVKSVTTLATLTCLISMIPGVEVEDDPRSSDIGKGRIGNQRFKLWGRYGQYIKLVAQLATEEAKSPQTGDIYHKERLDVITDFLRGKLNPILSPGVDVITGKTFKGEKMKYSPEFLSGYIAENISPLFLKDVAEAIRFQGLTHPTPLLSILGFYGIDMATFEADARQQTHILKNDYAHKYYGKDWAELGPPAQQLIRARHPMIRKYEEDAKREQTNFEWKGKIEQYAYDIGEKVIKSLSKDVRQMYKNTGAMIPKIEQGVGYNGSWWKMTMLRYEKFQKDLKPALEKSLGMLKSQPGWNELDSTIRRTMIEEMTKQTIKYVRQQMINNISMADLEAYNEPTTETVE